VQIKRLIAIAATLVLLALIPAFTQRNDVLTILFMAFLFIILGQTWNIMSGFTGQMSLGHAGFFGLGALTTRLLWLSGVPIIPAMVAGGVSALAMSMIVGGPVFRLRGVYFICSTLAAAEIMRITVGNILPNVSSMPAQSLANYDLSARYWLGLALAAITILATYLLVNSKPGLAMRAIRDDPETANSSGVNVTKYKMMAFGVSSFFVGMAGGLFAYFHVAFYFDQAFFPTWSLNAVYLTIIGGVGSILGPIVGALFFVLLNEVLTRVVPAEMSVIIFGIIFLLIIMYMPSGLVDLPRMVRLWITQLRFKLVRRAET